MKKIAWFLFLLCLQVGVFADLARFDLIPLKLENGARYLGLGNSGASIAFDAGAVFYNPGALPWSKGLSFTIKDANNISAGEAYPTGFGSTFGIGALINSYPGIKDQSGAIASSSSNALVLSAASRLDSMISIAGFDNLLKNTGVGLNIKTLIGQTFTQTGQADLSGTGWEMDAGIFNRYSSWIDLGLVGYNLLPYKTFGGGAVNWNRGEPESLPAYLRAGMTAKIVGDVRSPIYIENNKFMLTSDIEMRRNNLLFHFGGEWAVADTYAIRGGLSQTVRQNSVQLDPSIGVGYRASEWQFDLAIGKEPVNGDGSVYLSAGYFPSSWLFMAHPIESISLTDGVETFRPSIEVTGKVRPEVILTIDPGSVEVDANGNFSGFAPLVTGENTVSVTTDYADEKQTTQYTVIRKKLPETPAIISYPLNNSTVFETPVDVTGRLSDGIQALFINGQPVMVDESKNFRQSVPLKMGKNVINLEGKFDEFSVKSNLIVFRKPAPPKPKEDKAAKEKARKEALAEQAALAKQKAEQEALAKQEALAQKQALAKQKAEQEALARQEALAQKEALAEQKPKHKALIRHKTLSRKEALARQKAKREALKEAADRQRAAAAKAAAEKAKKAAALKKKAKLRRGYVSKLNFSKFGKKQNDIWNALLSIGYIDKHGRITDKFDGKRENFNLFGLFTPGEIDEIFNILNEPQSVRTAEARRLAMESRIIAAASREAAQIRKRAMDDQAKFEKLQALIEEYANLTIVARAKIKLPKGYLSVYSVSDGRYLALKYVGKGQVAVDLYIPSIGQWSTISHLPYSKVKDLI